MKDGKLIAGQFTSEDVVQIAPGLDLRRVALTSEEAFVLSRVGGGIRAGELLAGMGLPEDRTQAILRALLEKGCVAQKRHPAMYEQVDLPPERREEILDLEGRLDQASHFELLGLAPGASPTECKHAYYELSKRFHPDRYYGKELGSFRARVDKIFRKLTEVQQVLCDPAKRQAYEAANPHLKAVPRPAAPEEPVAHDEVRAADRASRIARHPYLAKIARVKEGLASARKDLAAGKVAAAGNALQMVLAVEPHNTEAKKLLALVQAEGVKQRADEAQQRGMELIAAGELTQAIAVFREALDAKPKPSVCRKGAELALRLDDAKSAKLFAARWVELEPRSPDAHACYAEVLHRAGMGKNARREAEAALELRPDHPAAKALMKKLRWLT